MISICNRVDGSYSNLLVKLNNNNVSKALEDFLGIVSNRRWTQKNVNPSASFVIDESHYYINDTNILRILSMGERNIYHQANDTSIRCLLPNPGSDSYNDFICFLILRAFQFHNRFNADNTISYSGLLSIKDIVNHIVGCISFPADQLYSTQKARIEDVVTSAFSYYEENRFIKKNNDPEIDSGSERYFMLPRGEQIFSLFFSQTILFTIFRDAFFWDDRKHDIRCSEEMSFSDLMKEALNYERSLLELDARFFNRVLGANMLRSYVTFWGDWLASEQFFRGISKSVQQYYKNDPIPDDLREALEQTRENVKSLSSTFESDFDEIALF